MSKRKYILKKHKIRNHDFTRKLFKLLHESTIRYSNYKLDIDMLIEGIFNRYDMTPNILHDMINELISSLSYDSEELPISNNLYIPLSTITCVTLLTSNTNNKQYYYIISDEKSNIYMYKESFFEKVGFGELDIIINNNIQNITRSSLEFYNINHYVSLIAKLINKNASNMSYLDILFKIMINIDNYFYEKLQKPNELITQNVLDIVGSYTANKGMLSKIRRINMENYEMSIYETTNILSKTIEETSNFIYKLLVSIKNNHNELTKLPKKRLNNKYDNKVLIYDYEYNKIQKLINRYSEESYVIVLSVIHKWVTNNNIEYNEPYILASSPLFKYSSEYYDDNRVFIHYLILGSLIKNYIIGVVMNIDNNDYLYEKDIIDLGKYIEVMKKMPNEIASFFIFYSYTVNVSSENKHGYGVFSDLSFNYDIELSYIEQNRIERSGILTVSVLRLNQMENRINEIRDRLLYLNFKINNIKLPKYSFDTTDLYSEQLLLNSELNLLLEQYNIFRNVENVMTNADNIIDDSRNQINHLEYNINQLEQNINSPNITEVERNEYISMINALEFDIIQLTQTINQNELIITQEYVDILGYKELIKHMSVVVEILINKSISLSKQIITDIYEPAIIYLLINIKHIYHYINNAELKENILLYTRTVFTNIFEPLDKLNLMDKVKIEPIPRENITDLSKHPFNILMSEIYTEIDNSLLESTPYYFKDYLYTKLANLTKYSFRGTDLNYIIKYSNGLNKSIYFKHKFMPLIHLLVCIFVHNKYSTEYKDVFSNLYDIYEIDNNITDTFKTIFNNLDKFTHNIFIVIDAIQDIVGHNNVSRYAHSLYELDILHIKSNISYITNNGRSNLDNRYKVHSIFDLSIEYYIDTDLTKYHFINTKTLITYMIGMLEYIVDIEKHHNSTLSMFYIIYNDIYELISNNFYAKYLEYHKTIKFEITELIHKISNIISNDTSDTTNFNSYNYSDESSSYINELNGFDDSYESHQLVISVFSDTLDLLDEYSSFDSDEDEYLPDNSN